MTSPARLDLLSGCAEVQPRQLQEESDQALLKRIRERGDTAALGELFIRYAHRIVRAISRNKHCYSDRVRAEVVFTLSGQMDIETMAELKRLINSEANGRGVVLNLRDLTLVDEDGVIFLERCESNNVKLENCPPYIREWINRQRLGRGQRWPQELFYRTKLREYFGQPARGRTVWRRKRTSVKRRSPNKRR